MKPIARKQKSSEYAAKLVTLLACLHSNSSIIFAASNNLVMALCSQLIRLASPPVGSCDFNLSRSSQLMSNISNAIFASVCRVVSFECLSSSGQLSSATVKLMSNLRFVQAGRVADQKGVWIRQYQCTSVDRSIFWHTQGLSGCRIFCSLGVGCECGDDSVEISFSWRGIALKHRNSNTIGSGLKVLKMICF